MNLEKHIPELVYNIRNFKLNHYPYSHCETNNFLPKELFDNAIKYFSEAISGIKTIENKYWYLYYSRGMAYERANKWEKAEKDFELKFC